MNIKQPKILFFIDGPVPSEVEKLDAFDLGVPVQFRNAQHVFKVEEEADGVAGVIPKAYAKHPTAEDALKAYKAEVKKARAKLAEVGGKAPKAGEQTETKTEGKTDGGEGGEGGQQGPAQGQGNADDGKGGPTPTPAVEDPAKAAAAAAAGAGKAPVAGGPAAGGWKQN